MTDTTITHGAETADLSHGKTAFSYCCECGTYDAHASVCACCGFDFEGDVTVDQAE